jgi:hypothetical protein
MFFSITFFASEQSRTKLPLMKTLGRKTVKTEKTSAPMLKSSKPAKASSKERRTPSHEEIAARSYDLYLARGGAPGDAEQDWLRAEAELSV